MQRTQRRVNRRPYRLGKRQAAADETRARIIAGARELLTGAGTELTIDAVARQAGVARMTVYYQFGSKIGVLEALFDEIAIRGALGELPAILARPDALEALRDFIGVFCRFWDGNRAMLRRLMSLAELDAELGATKEQRNERRREGLRLLLTRVAKEHGRPDPAAFDDAVDVLFALTAFATYDSLATDTRDMDQVWRLLHRLALAALGIPA